MKMCQPACQQEVKEVRVSEKKTRKGTGSLLPSGFKTPPRKPSTNRFQNYRSQDFPPSSLGSQSQSSSTPSYSPFPSEPLSGFSYPFHTPEDKKIEDHRKSIEEANNTPGDDFHSS
ncbi:hypothetical protein DFH28DRAFT_972331 [Melampsora americana]|nr:hypothetical protein DFH28DRAFT_972331 [Melampsora americana]